MERVGSLNELNIPAHKKVPLRMFVVLLVSGWTVAIGASIWYNQHETSKHAMESASIQARTAFEKDIVYRRWNSKHNGVFVPIVKGKFEPNPYLPPKGREIRDTDGVLYTKINPAYMTRLVHEVGTLDSGVVGHITSLKPTHPNNMPDEWERDALKQLESKEKKEVTALQKIKGISYLRLTRSLITEQSCLSCHAWQGYKEGDVRGAITISVPMEPFFTAATQTKNKLYATHFALWIVGLLGIGIGARQISNGIKERDSAKEKLLALANELERRVLERTEDARIH